jgi:hypothetical protein
VVVRPALPPLDGAAAALKSKYFLRRRIADAWIYVVGASAR